MLSFGLPLVSRAQVAAAAAVHNAIRVSYSICITVSGKSIDFSVTCTPVSVVHSPHTPGTMSGTLPVRFRPTPSRFSRGMQEVAAHHDVTWRTPYAAQRTSICAGLSDFDYSTNLMFHQANAACCAVACEAYAGRKANICFTYS
jgi:hypothetical protein